MSATTRRSRRRQSELSVERCGEESFADALMQPVGEAGAAVAARPVISLDGGALVFAERPDTPGDGDDYGEFESSTGRPRARKTAAAPRVVPGILVPIAPNTSAPAAREMKLVSHQGAWPSAPKHISSSVGPSQVKVVTPAGYCIRMNDAGVAYNLDQSVLRPSDRLSDVQAERCVTLLGRNNKVFVESAVYPGHKYPFFADKMLANNRQQFKCLNCKKLRTNVKSEYQRQCKLARAKGERPPPRPVTNRGMAPLKSIRVDLDGDYIFLCSLPIDTGHHVDCRPIPSTQVASEQFNRRLRALARDAGKYEHESEKARELQRLVRSRRGKMMFPIDGHSVDELPGRRRKKRQRLVGGISAAQGASEELAADQITGRPIDPIDRVLNELEAERRQTEAEADAHAAPYDQLDDVKKDIIKMFADNVRQCANGSLLDYLHGTLRSVGGDAQLFEQFVAGGQPVHHAHAIGAQQAGHIMQPAAVVAGSGVVGESHEQVDAFITL